jgi:hypothetical protein
MSQLAVGKCIIGSFRILFKQAVVQKSYPYFKQELLRPATHTHAFNAVMLVHHRQ